MAAETCADCGNDVADSARTIEFDGDTYCTDCTTRAECASCGAVGTLPEHVMDTGAELQCGNCGDVLTAGET